METSYPGSYVSESAREKMAASRRAWWKMKFQAAKHACRCGKPMRLLPYPRSNLTGLCIDCATK